MRFLFLLAARYSFRWSSRDFSRGGVGLPACTITYFLTSAWLKQGPFPPTRFCCPDHPQYYGPIRLFTRLPLGFHTTCLYRSLGWLWFQQPDEISPVPTTTFPTSHAPYAGGFFGAACQVLHTFLGLRLCVAGSAPSGPISGSTFRRRRIHLMLRAVGLLSFPRRLPRFSTTSHPVALEACYLAA